MTSHENHFNLQPSKQLKVMPKRGDIFVGFLSMLEVKPTSEGEEKKTKQKMDKIATLGSCPSTCSPSLSIHLKTLEWHGN